MNIYIYIYIYYNVQAVIYNGTKHKSVHFAKHKILDISAVIRHWSNKQRIDIGDSRYENRVVWSQLIILHGFDAELSGYEVSYTYVTYPKFGINCVHMYICVYLYVHIDTYIYSWSDMKLVMHIYMYIYI